MRTAIVVCMVVVCMVAAFASVARADLPKCSPEWATATLQKADGKDESILNKAITTISQCGKGAELLLGVAKQVRLGPKEPPVRPPTVKPEEPAEKSEDPKQETVKKETSKGPSLSTTLIKALMKELKRELLAEIVALQKKCKNLRSCEARDRQSLLSRLSRYFAIAGSANAREQSLAEAFELIAEFSAASPENRLAHSIAEAAERLPEDRKTQLRSKYDHFSRVLSTPNGPDRLAVLLEHPEQLVPMQADVEAPAAAPIAAIGPSRAAVGGRAVIVSVDFRGLSRPDCAPELAEKLQMALDRKRPIGVKLYELESPGAASPHVEIAATVVNGGPGSPCDAAAERQCIETLVSTSFDPTTVDNKRPMIRSGSYERCTVPSSKELDSMAQRIFDSFSVALRASGVSVEQARLIQPKCVHLQTEIDEPAWNRLRTDRRPKSLYLQAAAENWRGFQQELAEALEAHRNVFGEVWRNSPSPATGTISISWPKREIDDKAPPPEVRLTLRWNGPGGPPDAGVRFTPKRTQECSFTLLAFQQTVAAWTTSWLLGLYVPDIAPHTVTRKNWRLAPLGLLVPGMPQLLDKNSANDVRGFIFAGVDMTLVVTAAALVLASVEARKDYSDTAQSEALDRANDLLTAGFAVGGAALAPRLLSFFW